MILIWLDVERVGRYVHDKCFGNPIRCIQPVEIARSGIAPGHGRAGNIAGRRAQGVDRQEGIVKGGGKIRDQGCIARAGKGLCRRNIGGRILINDILPGT